MLRAVSLNNMGVEMIRNGFYPEALLTLRDSVTILKTSFLSPTASHREETLRNSIENETAVAKNMRDAIIRMARVSKDSLLTKDPRLQYLRCQQPSISVLAHNEHDYETIQKA